MSSFEQRGKSSWRISVMVDTPQGRVPVRRSIKFPESMPIAQQRRKAELEMMRMELDAADGRLRPGPPLTVRDLAEAWMQRHVVPELSPVTAANYRHLLDARILPMLGDVPVERLTPQVIEQFIADVRAGGRRTSRLDDAQLRRRRSPSDRAKLADEPAKPLSGRTLRSYYDCLNTMFDRCRHWGLIWENPMELADRPKAKSKPVRYLDDVEAVDLLRQLQYEDNMSFRCAVLLGLCCGLRLGEVGALTWQDVDWRRSRIDISKALKYTPSEGNFVGPPKTEASERQIKLPDGMMALLDQTRRQHLEWATLMGDRWHGVGRIVCSWDGAPVHHDTPSKQFRRFADRHGFQGVRFHDLRHTHATLLFANNIDAVAVASRLGHAKADTTLRIYAHALRRRDDDSADAMQHILDQVGDPDDTP